MAVEPIDKRHALDLFHRKPRSNANEKDAAGFAQSLDYVPLAITQAAAYIS